MGFPHWYEREIWFVDVSQDLNKAENFDYIDIWLPYSLPIMNCCFQSE